MINKIHDISYSKLNTFNQCPRKFYETYLNDDPNTVISTSDTHRAYIGIMVQYIFEKITNDNLHQTMTYDELCTQIDADLKLLKPFILDLGPIEKAEYEHKLAGTKPDRIDTRELHATGGVIVDKSPKCIVETSSGYIIWIAQNSIIKKIREHYKAPLKKYLQDFNVDNIQCEVPLIIKRGNRTFKGTVDFIEDLGATIRVFDGKKKKTDDLHSKNQLINYKFLVESHYGKPVSECGYFYWEENSYEKVEISDKDISEFLSKAESTFDEIESYTSPDQFKMTPEYVPCMFCIISNACVANGGNEDITEI